jgi:hypothetical protein
MVVLQPGEHPFYFTSGARDHVEMPRDGYMTALRANPPIWTAHTHPTGSALSLQDIRVQVAMNGRRQVVFGPHGEWYDLEVTDLAQAKKDVGEGRREAFWYTTATKGKFAAAFDRLKNRAYADARKATDQWAAQQFGWTPSPHPLTPERPERSGFRLPDGRWITRKEAGELKPALKTQFSQAFRDLSPRIWIGLAQKYPWLKFRYHIRTGPYAATSTD